MAKLSGLEIQDIITGAFVDASDVINFFRNDEGGAEWARVNQAEIENEREYAEAVARIKEDVERVAKIRIEADLAGREFDQDSVYLHLFHNATRAEIETLAGLTYAEADEIREDVGTLF